MDIEFSLEQTFSKKVWSRKPAWHKCNSSNITAYQQCMDNNINSNGDVFDKLNVLKCNNVTCSECDHKTEINSLCTALVNCCLKSGLKHLPKTQPPKRNKIPNWSSSIQPLKEKSILWHQIWDSAGRPHTGSIANIMRQTRARYHYAIRSLCKNMERERFLKLAESVAASNDRDMWKEIKKLSRIRNNVIISQMDNITGAPEIANLFANKYKAVYQSVSYDNVSINKVKEKITDNIECSTCVIQTEDVVKAINSLKSGKHDGDKGLYSNHLKLSTLLFKQLLCKLFNSMIIHGHSPDEMLGAVLVSIPKDKRGSLSSSDNYRGIAMCSAIGKVFDLLIMKKYSKNLASSNLQFAFKPEHSTVMATTILTETVRHYIDNNSPVYACMLDASKAFDRVDYCKLFDILLKRKIPKVVLRVLLDMYLRQSNCAAWNGSYSCSFSAENGVRQGSILSPILFSVYMDELILHLKSLSIGCHIGNHYVGAIVYADDIVLICPSVRGLRSMINAAVDFAKGHSILFNPAKSYGIKFSRTGEMYNGSEVFIDGKPLQWKRSGKYLGTMLSSTLDSAEDINAKAQSFNYKVNEIMNKFKCASVSIVSKLISKYCYSYYGAVNWDLVKIKPIGVQWNKMVRKLFHLPQTCHTCFLPIIIGHQSPNVMLTKRYINHIHTMYKSHNSIVKYIAEISVDRYQGVLGKNLRYTQMSYFSTLSMKSMVNVSLIHKLKHLVKDNINFDDAGFVKELASIMKNNLIVCNMTQNEVKDILDFVITR